MANLSLFRGDTYVFEVPAFVGTNPQSLVGSLVSFTAKRILADADAAAVIRKSTDDGGITVEVGDDDVVENVARITIDPADTSTLENSKTVLEYDVQMKAPDDAIYTLDRGTLLIFPDVTRAT